MPRWPLATRIIPFLVSCGVPARWLALSAPIYLILGLIWLAAVAGHPLAAVPLAVIALITFTVWLAALSAVIMTIVVESSEGNDEIHHWPAAVMSEWVGEFFYVLFACLVSPLPGWLLGRYVMQDQPAATLLFVGSLVVSFPIILLSQLDVGSAFGVASPRVIASLVRLPLTWLMFYSEIALLVAFCVGATIAVELILPILGYALVPFYIAAILLAARILGRLAWKLAESMPSRE